VTQSFRPAERTSSHFNGGCTLLVDLRGKQVRYFVRKRVNHAGRLQAQQAFDLESLNPLRAAYFAGRNGGFEPLALLHSAF
jgi:hypothetical protein